MKIFFLVAYIVGAFMMFSVALDEQNWWPLLVGLWSALSAHEILDEVDTNEKP